MEKAIGKNMNATHATALKANKTKMASWWTTNKPAISAKATKVINILDKFLDNVPKFLGRLIASGVIWAIVLNVVSAYFWPELPDKIPVFYEFCNGFLVLVEYLIKVAFGGIASIFNGSFFEVAKSNLQEFANLWNTFWSWAGSLTF